jgi:hypothetical protein
MLARAAFAAAVVGVKTCLDPLLFQRDQVAYPTDPGRPLTAGEARLAHRLFADQINTDDIRLFFTPYEHPAHSAMVFGSTIMKFYGRGAHEDDYSRPRSAYSFNRFVHELAHIWQRQHGLRTVFNLGVHKPDEDYRYQLRPRARFLEFGQEQQGAMMGDYAEQIFYRHRTHGEYHPAHGGPAQNLSLLIKVVEHQFPNARRTRLMFEAQRAKRPAATRQLI